MESGGISRRTLVLGAAGAAVVLGGGGAVARHEIDTHPGLRRFFGECGSTPPLPGAGTYVVHSHTMQSTSMGREMPYAVAIPRLEGYRSEPLPLIIALPGDGGAETDFANDLGLPNYANQAGLQACFVSPGNVDTSYYHPRQDGTDTLAYVVDELVPLVERTLHVGGSRKNRAVYGVSMGGFGALLIAQRYPHLVCAAAAGSPAVFTTYHDAVTGHSQTFDSEADWQRWGLWNQLGTMGQVPVRIDCGDADPFAATARQLLARIPHAVGGISSGCHDRGFWRRHARQDLEFLGEFLI
ncbi:MAG TPA: alpha/beta hydrolase-fold protein [Mycobacteriales bacterium]|nr:alpha/beta hydrolase-fold protein [Mycobacteriales bacterium]